MKAEDCSCVPLVASGKAERRQKITAMSCPECKTIQNIVVGGIIGDIAPSYRSEAGRLCLHCGCSDIRIWNMVTCPKCQGTMKPTGDREFWT